MIQVVATVEDWQNPEEPRAWRDVMMNITKRHPALWDRGEQARREKDRKEHVEPKHLLFPNYLDKVAFKAKFNGEDFKVIADHIHWATLPADELAKNGRRKFRAFQIALKNITHKHPIGKIALWVFGWFAVMYILGHVMAKL
jgi:hypothetical protein